MVIVMKKISRHRWMSSFVLKGNKMKHNQISLENIQASIVQVTSSEELGTMSKRN